MSDLAAKYAIPSELMAFVDDRFLQVLDEDESRKTIQFHIPSKRHADTQGRITAYSLTWIHPGFNEQFCHYYDEQPGDLPNFYVTQDTSEVGDEQIELETLDDLVDWLNALRMADVA